MYVYLYAFISLSCHNIKFEWNGAVGCELVVVLGANMSKQRTLSQESCSKRLTNARLPRPAPPLAIHLIEFAF